MLRVRDERWKLAQAIETPIDKTARSEVPAASAG